MRLDLAALSFLMLLSVGCADDMRPLDPEENERSDAAIPDSDSDSWADVGIDTPPDLPETCLPVACGNLCGTLSNDCGETVECGSCLEEAEIEEMAEIVDAYAAETAARSYATDVTDFDLDRLADETRDILGRHRSAQTGLISALRHVLLESRIGHAAFYEGATFRCNQFEGGGDGSASLLGACAVPHPEGMLIADVSETNTLGLSPGDLVVAANQYSGEALYDWSLSLAVCGGSAASESARREVAARSFFSALPTDTTLEVQRPDGTSRLVEIPENADDELFCLDPLGRSTNLVAEAYLREDGIAVIRLPRFTPVGGFNQTDPFADQMDALADEIAAEFEKVRDADALIWDLRANIGGASPVGFRIVGGMPGLREVPIARCTTRVPDTDPPQYRYQGPDYDLVAHPRFTFSGPVAVLVDGRSISAADYFARAVALGTDALIFGTPTSGAYGGSGSTFEISGSPNLVAAYDPFRCNDAEGNPLETRGVEPDVHVQYEPSDLSAGVDTVLERAASEIRGE